MDSLQSTQVFSARLQLALNLSYSLPGLYFVGVYGVFNGDYSGGAGEHPAIGTKTENQFPLDSAGVFQPVAIVIPFENGTRPALPPRFSGIVHLCRPLPGDTRLALRTSQITVFSGGSVYVLLTGSIITSVRSSKDWKPFIAVLKQHRCVASQVLAGARSEQCPSPRP